MKRVLINANAVFANQFKELNGFTFFAAIEQAIKKMLEGLDVKMVEEKDYSAIFEINDEANPVPCDALQKFLIDQFDLDGEKALVSVYNYKPEFVFGFNFTKNSGNNYIKKIAEINQLKLKLQEEIVGQDHAIDVVIDALIKANTFNGEQENKPFLTCLFAGPTGSGKTFLAESVVKGLNMPYLSFSAPDYFADRTMDKLISFVTDHPHGALIFNDFESFSPLFNSIVLNAYFTGGLYGLSLKGLTVFFTTSGGRSIYGENTSFNFASLTSEEIIDSLRKEIDPKLKGPAFDDLILNILKNEHVAMFNHLDSFSSQLLLAVHLKNYAKSFMESTNINVDMNYFEFARFVLFSNSDEKDVKTLESKAEELFNEQVSFLATQSDEESKKPLIELVKNVSMSIDLENGEEEVKKLFENRTLEALFIANKADYEVFSKLQIPNLHLNFAANVKDLKEKIDNGIDFILLDPTIGNKDRSGKLPVDIEDYNSVGMEIFNYINRYRNRTPLYLISNSENGHPYSSFHTLILRGAVDVVFYSASDLKGLDHLLNALTVNYELGYDMDFLHREHLKLESNPSQEIKKDDKGVYTLEVSYKKLKLRSGSIATFDAEELEQKDINLFSDIVGNSIPKEILLKYGRYLSNTQEYLNSGLLPPKMILIHGGEQFGKTAIIKAFANEVRAKLVKLDCKKLLTTAVSLEDFYSRIRSAFNNARRSSPCVLHIDNVEMLFPAAYNEIIDKCLVIFKEEVEFTAKDIYHPVLVVAERESGASLHPSLYELASRNISLEIPTAEELEEFITRYFEKKHVKSVSKKVIRNFAKRNFPTVFSELKRVLDFAINYAQGQPLTDELLSESLDVYNEGDLSARARREEDTYSTAYHEMGHYLLMRLFGSKPLFVTIVPRGQYGGYTMNEYDERAATYTKQWYLNRICISFGGRAAEVIAVGEEEGTNTGISGDIANATNCARNMIMYYAMGDKTLSAFNYYELNANSQIIYEQINDILKEQYERAIRLLNLNRANLDKLSKALMDKGSIIGDELEELVPDKDLILEEK